MMLINRLIVTAVLYFFHVVGTQYHVVMVLIMVNICKSFSTLRNHKSNHHRLVMKRANQ